MYRQMLDEMIGKKFNIVHVCSSKYHVSFGLNGRLIKISKFYRIVDGNYNFVSFEVDDIDLILDDTIYLR